MRREQIERLNDVKAHRDEAKVKEALAAITECVRTKEGNLLDLAVKAAGLRATLGEISDACEEVVGRYKSCNPNNFRCVFKRNKTDADFQRAQQMTAEFAKREGRQPVS